MSPAPLSRRSLFAAGSALAVTTALPALASSAPPIEDHPARLPTAATASIEPTPIAKLWAKRNAVREQTSAAYRIVRQIQRKAWRRAGPVDPAIAYSTKNDRLGLERRGRDKTPYIDPLHIEATLRNIDRAAREPAAWSGRPFVPGKRQIMREQRLRALLKLSQQYDNRVRQIQDGLGYDEANQKAEALLRKQGEIECRIMAKPSVSVGDLQIKFAVADDDYDHALIALVDLRRLMQRRALAQAFAEA